MKLKHLQAIFIIIILFNLSCTSYKDVPYFQNATPDGVFIEKITNFSPLTAQPGDILAIHVTSLNHDLDAIINYNLDQVNSNTNSTISSSSPAAPNITLGENAVVGYLVDPLGDIHLPMVGEVKVADSSISNITTNIKLRLKEYMTDPNVEIRIQNFKISVLGDVKTPGYFNPQDEHITVLQALALAGDLNSTGIRTNVLLIREIDGIRQYIPLNLTSINTISSPYYYLKNNDIIYVRPNKARVENDGTAFQKASIVLAVLSIIVYLIKK